MMNLVISDGIGDCRATTSKIYERLILVPLKKLIKLAYLCRLQAQKYDLSDTLTRLKILT